MWTHRLPLSRWISSSRWRLSWILSMLGWFKNPHGPEIKAVKQVLLSLADVFDASVQMD